MDTVKRIIMGKAGKTIIGGVVLGLPTFAASINFLPMEIVVGATLIWASVGAFIGFIIFSKVGLRNIVRNKGSLAGAFVLGSLNLFITISIVREGGKAIAFFFFLNTPTWSVFWFAIDPALEYSLFHVAALLGVVLWAAIGAAIGAIPSIARSGPRQNAS